MGALLRTIGAVLLKSSPALVFGAAAFWAFHQLSKHAGEEEERMAKKRRTRQKKAEEEIKGQENPEEDLGQDC